MFDKEMYDWCCELQKHIQDRYPQDNRLCHLIACTQLTKEVSEVLDCIPWKFERGMEPEPRERLLEELADVFNFYMRLLWVHDVTPEEFRHAWIKKSEVVERRLGCPGLITTVLKHQEQG